MQKDKNKKKAVKGATTPGGSDAYIRALELLKDRKKGYVPYDKAFYSKGETLATFPRSISGDLLNFLGHEFYWKRLPGKALILYVKSSFTNELRKKGLVELCQFRVPNSWIGVGRFKIDWPDREKEDGQTQFLISLYLYSTKAIDFDYLVSNENATAAFMACLFLGKENAELFDNLATERFISFA